MPDAHARLEAAADRSAAPAVVRAVLGRLLAERPGAGDRLVEGGDLNDLGRTVVAVAAASNVLGRLCVADPAALDVLEALDQPTPWDDGDTEALARSKRLSLLRIAARDLVGEDPLEEVGARLADLAGRVLDAAVMLSAGSVDSPGPDADNPPIAVIGMGKLGGSELNYASDVDVLFVSADERAERARRVLQVARASFRVDVDLRPEGRAGALARPLESYRSYWARWADAWEFQALLKARPVAGDVALGVAFADAAARSVWERTFTADELAQLRAMKARAEAEVDRRRLAERELKRGRGGIRDVEFAVQLLQLVHGRLDPAIRERSTLGALAELGAAGYVSTEDATALAGHYRFLRTVEHRLQLVEEEQTHSLPTAFEARERLARVLGFDDTPQAGAVARFEDELRRRQAEVRAIHERLFFRPLLESFAGTAPMTDEAIDRRLAAFGFPDARRTRAAVDELAGGLTRRSRLMAQLLPLLLDWLSLTPDPDMGLVGLRTLVSGRHQRALLVSSFRESPETARRLCLLLGSSRALGEALQRNPELIAVLDDDAALAATPRADLVADAAPRLARAADDAARRAQLVRLRQDQFVRVAARDLLGLDAVEDTGGALSSVADALVESALGQSGGDDGFCVVGMGRLGGEELAYASDLDLLFVHDGAVELGVARSETLLHLLHGPSPAGRVVEVDLGLRPEGAQGPLSRDVAGYRHYFERWAQVWERQALLRARLVAGDAELGTRFAGAVEEFVWGRPLTDDDVVHIRRMKARIERERIPAGEDAQFHLKLGKGSLSDVEWTVQLLQLRHGVRGASTMGALATLAERDILAPADAEALRSSYRFCEHTRNRLHLVGALPGGAKGGDALPTQAPLLSRLARSLGTTPAALRDEYRRVTRRARRVTERLFYDIEDA